MISGLIKIIFDFLDLHLAHQVPSKMGFGHQINSKEGLDDYSNFIIDTVAYQQKPLNIIEFAAGRGVLATEIIKISNVESYLACDIDSSGLELLQSRLIGNPDGLKLKTLVLDVLNPSLEGEQLFDIVIADKFLHLLTPEEVEKVFQFAYKLLKEGGLFIISSASSTNFVFKRTEPTSEHELYRKLKDDMLTKLWYNIAKPYVFFITREYISQLSSTIGFVFTEDSIFPSTEDYLTLALCKNSNYINQ